MITMKDKLHIIGVDMGYGNMKTAIVNDKNISTIKSITCAVGH